MREKLARLNLVIYLPKDEKKFLEGMAPAFRRNGRQRSGIAAALLELARIGATCLREHAKEEILDPQTISIEEALDQGLTIPGLTKRPAVINSRPINLWRPPNGDDDA
jgi:hypothetical protein